MSADRFIEGVPTTLIAYCPLFNPTGYYECKGKERKGTTNVVSLHCTRGAFPPRDLVPVFFLAIEKTEESDKLNVSPGAQVQI